MGILSATRINKFGDYHIKGTNAFIIKDDDKFKLHAGRDYENALVENL